MMRKQVATHRNMKTDLQLGAMTDLAHGRTNSATQTRTPTMNKQDAEQRFILMDPSQLGVRMEQAHGQMSMGTPKHGQLQKLPTMRRADAQLRPTTPAKYGPGAKMVSPPTQTKQEISKNGIHHLRNYEKTVHSYSPTKMGRLK